MSVRAGRISPADTQPPSADSKNPTRTQKVTHIVIVLYTIYLYHAHIN